MQVTLLAVGKLRPALREVCDDYLRRLGKYLPVQEREVREAGRSATVQLQREAEAERIVEALSPRATLVLLDQDGAAWSSEDLARQLEQWRIASRDIALVVGGATGFAASLRERARQTWSLGPLTLPHQLARVIVVEQLYRASTILRGEPYHKGVR